MSDCCTVKVTGDTLVTSVTVSPSSKCMTVGGSAYLTATVCPEGATNKCITWCSSNTSVATVNPTSGLVMAQGAGTATIYATSQDGSGKQGSCKVTVEAVPVSSVTVCPTSKTMRVGESAYLTATVYPTNATNKSVIWCSSNPDVVSVDNNGWIQAKATGSSVVTATTIDGGYTAKCNITVRMKKAVIIVPGVMCTKLVLTSAQNNLPAGTQVWPPIQGGENFLDPSVILETYHKLKSLECDKDGASVYNLAVKSTDNYGAFDSYKKLYIELSREHGANRDIIFFGYDWRQPNADSGALLRAKVNEYDSVIIVAHSMGGLVTSHMLRDSAIRDKIDKVITLGTPYLGSLEMIPVMYNGHFGYIDTAMEDLPKALAQIAKEIAIQPILQAMAVNIPSLYELLPTEKWFELTDKKFFSYTKLYTVPGYDENQIFISPTYSNTKNLLYNNLNDFNSNLLSQAECMHSNLFINGNHITNYVDTYYIVGTNKSTVTGIKSKISAETEELEGSDLEYTITIDGDGTVPIWSANIGSLYLDKTYYASNREHGGTYDFDNAMVESEGLMVSENVIQLIQNIINNNSNSLPSGISKIQS